MTTAGFPLPLTPFERYMLLDERPGYPMTFVGRVDFDGVFRKDLLEDAVRAVHQRHPMLRTTVQGRRTWRAPKPAAELRPLRWLPWSEDTPQEALEGIDVGRDIGVRVYAQQGRDRARLTGHFHHAVADGLGMVRFFEDIMAAYLAATSEAGTEPAWGPSDPERLGARGEGRRTRSSSGRPATGTNPLPPAGEIAGFFLRRPARLRARGGSAAPGSSTSPLSFHDFDAAAFGRIRRLARAHDASVNDVFLSALLQTVAEWNAPADPYRGRRWLRVLVPTDLRTRRDAELGAANILGYAFLDRRAHACGDASALLTSVSQEMRGVRLARVGHWILDGLAALDRIPGLLRLFLRPRVTLATVVFSNIGRVGVRVPGTQRDGPDEVAARCPVPLRVVGAGPLRPGTRAFFFLSRVRGTLTLTLRTDPRYLDGDASRALLAAYVGKVNDMTGPGALP